MRFTDAMQYLIVETRQTSLKSEMAYSRNLSKLAIMDIHGLSWSILAYQGLWAYIYIYKAVCGSFSNHPF